MSKSGGGSPARFKTRYVDVAADEAPLTQRTATVLEGGDAAEDSADGDDDHEVAVGKRVVPIVGVRFYKGVVTTGELVVLVREPRNPYDRNAIAVMNLHGEQVGHMKREVALALSKVMDDASLQCTVEGKVTGDTNDPYTITMTIKVFTTDASKVERIKTTTMRYGLKLAAPDEDVPLSSVRAFSFHGGGSYSYGDGGGGGAGYARSHSTASASTAASQRRAAERRAAEQAELASARERNANREVIMSLRDAATAADTLYGDTSKGVDDMPMLDGQPDGVRTALLPYQLQGVRWMVDREAGKTAGGVWVKDGTMWRNTVTQHRAPSAPTDPCRGGLLSDAMGLGKTLQTLSVVAEDLGKNGRDAAKGERTTLVICPASLLSGWADQAVQHTGLSVQIYHGTGRSLGGELPDVLVTTYGTVSSEFGGKLPPNVAADLGTDANGAANGGRKATGRKGPLFKIAKWRRIVLDEAHIIRNARSAQTRAVLSLPAEFKWCLTGTPVVNKVDDLFPVLSFLRAEPLNTSTLFRRLVLRPIKALDVAGIETLKLVLRSVCLRRTKTTQFRGQPLLTLPEKRTFVHKVELSEEERQWYRRMRDRTAEFVREQIEADTMSINFSHILAMLMSLRMMCVHVDLVRAMLAVSNRFATRKDEVLAELAAARSGTRTRRGARAAQAVQAAPQLTLLGLDELDALLNVMMDKLSPGAAADDEEECPVCMEPLERETAVVTRCKHIFCSDCFKPVAVTRCCPLCRQEISEKTVASAEIAEKERKRVEDDAAASQSQSGSKGKGKKRTKRQRGRGNSDDSWSDEEEDDDDEVEEEDEEEDEEAAARRQKRDLDREIAKAKQVARMDPAVLGASSTKIDMLVDELRERLAKDATTKAIVYSQWTSVLGVIQHQLAERLPDVGIVTLDGSMAVKARQASIARFRDDAAVSVFLISLKAGGVGLNLTSANTVFLMDPWWSAAAEEQAIDRAHRLGQTRDVDVIRIVAKDTIEEAIMELQEKKTRITKEAMDGAGGSASKAGTSTLTASDLGTLFSLGVSLEK